MKKAAITVMACLMLSALASAQNTPILPMIINGKVILDGAEAPAGTIVKAYIGDREISSHTLVESGDYALTIAGSNDDEGSKLYFTVNGIPVSNVDLTWSSGAVETRTIVAETPAITGAAVDVETNTAAGEDKSYRTAGYLTIGAIATLVALVLVSFLVRKPLKQNKQ